MIYLIIVEENLKSRYKNSTNISVDICPWDNKLCE